MEPRAGGHGEGVPEPGHHGECLGSDADQERSKNSLPERVSGVGAR